MNPVQITQTQDENVNPTMVAHPLLETNLVAQITVTKMTQKHLKFGKQIPTHELRPVSAHIRATSYVKKHMHKLRIKKEENRKESKTNHPKKNTGK